jgi:hypothetical protein
MQALSNTKIIMLLALINTTVSLPLFAENLLASSVAVKPELENHIDITNDLSISIEGVQNQVTIPQIQNISAALSPLSDENEIKRPLALNPTLLLDHIKKSENQFIPLIQDAIIFANFDDELPAIVNYYTFSTEGSIIKFYTDAFGEPTTKEKKRGRLSLNYQKNEQLIIVIISPQNNKQQVDVIVTSHLTAQ